MPRIRRRGFTLVEIVIVIAVMGILATVALPKLTQATTTLSVRAAAQDVAALVAVARATAIQTGRPAWFIRSGNTVGVATLPDGTGTLTYSQQKDMNAEHGVTVTATYDTVRFDPRGIGDVYSGKVSIVAVKGAARDSACILGLGRISTKDCSL